AGTFTATLTVTDNAGLTAKNSVTITVSPNPTQKLHVSTITMSLVAVKHGSAANASVKVLDQSGVAHSGATVTGSWSGIVSGTSTATTNSTGTASLTSSKTNSSGTIKFT